MTGSTLEDPNGSPMSKLGSWCEVCFNISETAAVESGQAVEDGDYDELPHISWFGIGDRTYRIYGTFQLFKETPSPDCHFCKFLSAVADGFVPVQNSHVDAMIIYLEEECISIELRPLGSTEERVYVHVYRPADTVTEQSAAVSAAYEHIPVLPDIDLPNSENSFNYLKTCLQTCVDTHDECRQDASSPPPRRLLRLGPLGDSSVRLYETPAGFREPYVALSYCWGRSATLKTTSANLAELTAGFDVARLPAAIRDAIRVTQRLGVKYIWIDALCIVQDSRSDWEEQSARMCAIYEQAYLTVAAASSPAADVSFAEHAARPPTVRYRIPAGAHEEERGETAEVVLAARAECTSGHHYNPTGRSAGRAAPESILTRAWTLQESVLATRCAAFSTDELQWRCRALAACECEMPPDFRRDLDVAAHMDGGADQRLRLFDQVVEQYTQRALTVASDKLPALSGICQMIVGGDGDGGAPSRYLAGLWHEALPYCLLWERATDVEGSDVPIPAGRYRAPSFSWASLDCPVYAFADRQDVRASAEVLDCVATPAGADPFGAVAPGASLTARGRLVVGVPVYQVDEDEGGGPYRYRYRVRPRGTRDEEFVADGPLEAFEYGDADGQVRRSVRRRRRGEGENGIAEKDNEGKEGLLETGSMVSLFIVARRRHPPNDFSTYYFLALGAAAAAPDTAFERLGTVGLGFGHHDFDNVPERTVTIL
ncbi:HET-domain-containing protein [Hypoxylon sp. FL1284]|nr:HET-domain-containing protein [Hypoxylon sp. FL1284]